MSINRYDSKCHRDKDFQLQFRYVCRDLCESFFHGIFYRAWKQGCGFFRKEPNKAKKGHTQKNHKMSKQAEKHKKNGETFDRFWKERFHACDFRTHETCFRKKNFEKAAEYCQWWILVLFPTFKIVLQRLFWKPFLKTTSNYMTLLIILLLNR